MKAVMELVYGICCKLLVMQILKYFLNCSMESASMKNWETEILESEHKSTSKLQNLGVKYKFKLNPFRTINPYHKPIEDHMLQSSSTYESRKGKPNLMRFFIMFSFLIRKFQQNKKRRTSRWLQQLIGFSRSRIE